MNEKPIRKSYMKTMRKALDTGDYVTASIAWDRLKEKAENTDKFGERTQNPNIKFPESVIDMGIEFYGIVSEVYNGMDHLTHNLISLIKFKVDKGYELDANKINSLLKKATEF